MDRSAAGSEKHQAPKAFLQRHDQRTVAMLVALALVALLLWRIDLWRRGIDLIDFDRLPARQARFLVDLNEAAWPELELLPEVGETTAHRIVAYRDEHGAFTSIEQLLDIDGIGPATLDKMRPYLLPLDDDPAEAASPSSK